MKMTHMVFSSPTGGLTTTNVAIALNDSFPNADLSYSQVVGVISGSQGGSVTNWKINGSLINGTHGHVYGKSPNNINMASTVCKMIPTTGGLVFYLGSHNYNTTNQQNINGIRMYLNAFLTPSIMTCVGPLAVKLTDFKGRKANNMVKLTWEVEENEDCSFFEVESSIDSKNFNTVTTIHSKDVHGKVDYGIEIPNDSRKIFYRLKIINKIEGSSYSQIVKISNNEPQTTITLEGNPVHDKLSFVINTTYSSNYTVCIYNTLGAKIYEELLPLQIGIKNIQIPLSQSIPAGILIMEVKDTKQTIRTKIMKQ